MVERKTAEQGYVDQRTELSLGEIGSASEPADERDEGLLFANESRSYLMFRLAGEPTD
jgi:hypothetical protein